MKTLWIAREQDTTPGGADTLTPCDDREDALTKATCYLNRLTDREKKTHAVTIEAYKVDCPENATAEEAYESLNDHPWWPDPIIYEKL